MVAFKEAFGELAFGWLAGLLQSSMQGSRLSRLSLHHRSDQSKNTHILRPEIGQHVG